MVKLKIYRVENYIVFIVESVLKFRVKCMDIGKGEELGIIMDFYERNDYL